MAKKGLFIVIEGIDGAGTSTKVRGLHKYMLENNPHLDIITTSEPWKSNSINATLREDSDAYSKKELMTERYIANRKNHAVRLIEPILNLGGIVICDRYTPSTFAYQRAQGVPFNTIMKLHEEQNLPTPDITYFLDVNPGVAIKRLGKRPSLDKFENNPKFVKEVINHYRGLVNSVAKNKKNHKFFGPIVKIKSSKFSWITMQAIQKDFENFFRSWSAGQSLKEFNDLST